MQEESRDNNYIIINNFKVFVGLPVICKSTMSYCITTHVSQGSTYNFPYSIYEYQFFYQPLLYTSMSRSTKKRYINLIDYKPQVSTGYFYKITDSKQ